MATSLPSLPRIARLARVRPVRSCACGCGQPTGKTWFPGHDGRATGWALRVERGMALLAVPANERAGCVILLRKRGSFAAVVERGNPRAVAA